MNYSDLLDAKTLQGIVATNSINYVHTVFDALQQGKTVVPLREKDDQARISATGLEQIIEPTAQTGWFQPNFTPQQSQKIALISFTSGTEGLPKGVMVSHNALHDVVARLQEISHVDESICEYIGVPVYHSFGFGRCRLIGSVRGKAYLPEQGFNPKEIAEMLALGQINSISAVPSLLRILLEYKQLFTHTEKLRWIEIGSQPMSLEEKKSLRDLFPNACIVQHYGLTEASRTTLLRIDGTDDKHLDSVGKTYGKSEIEISDDGKICIKGPHLASALLIAGEIQPLPSSDGWFKTNDLGNISNSGYLQFMGRADNVINVGGQKITAELVENLLRKTLNITAGIAVSRTEDSTYGEAILLAKDNTCAIEIDALGQTAEKIVAENGISARGIIRLFECEALPVTDTGKVQRNLLREWYSDKTATLKPEPSTQTKAPESTRDKLIYAFQQVAGNTVTVNADSSFTALRLDSISAVKLSIQIEKIIGNIPNDWRAQTISALEKIADNNQKTDGQSDASPTPNPTGRVNGNPSGISFWQLIKEDYATHERDPFSQGFWAVFNNRFGNWRMDIKSKPIRFLMTQLYRLQRRAVQVVCGVKLDYTVPLGRRVKLEHFGGMILGAKSIGDDVTIRQNTTFGLKDLSDRTGKPTIEKGVNIGAGAVIVGDITIGRFSVVGPNTVIDSDIPPFSVVSAPASVVTSIKK